MFRKFNASRTGRDTASRTRDMSSYSVQCDRSGFRASASDCVLQWNGVYVLAKYAENRNVQEFIQVPKDDIAVPIARPWDLDNEIDPTTLPEDVPL